MLVHIGVSIYVCNYMETKEHCQGFLNCPPFIL